MNYAYVYTVVARLGDHKGVRPCASPQNVKIILCKMKHVKIRILSVFRGDYNQLRKE